MTATLDDEVAELRRANAELQQRLDEALARESATGEVLSVINSSPGDLAPVFDAMLEKALSLCEAAQGTLRIYDGEKFNLVAVKGEEALVEAVQRLGPIIPASHNSWTPLVKGDMLVHIVDSRETPGYREIAATRERIDRGEIRTWLAVPLRKGDVLLGAFAVYRREVRPFSDKQIALLRNFAAQAVIAMENARLINETREALEQQTATAEVLGVINASPGDLAPVFDAIVDKAMRLCGAAFGGLHTYDGERFTIGTSLGHPRYGELVRGLGPVRPDPRRGTTIDRIAGGERVIQIADIAEDLGPEAEFSVRRATIDFGFHTLLSIALRRDEKLFGALHLYRQEVRPFTDKQIALLQNFAAQAVIAMENARLITETREALDQQTATAEVLQVINSSPGDLAPVFNAMLERALDLCDVPFGGLWTYDGTRAHPAVLYGVPPEMAEFYQAPIKDSPGGWIYSLAQGAPLVHVPDITADQVYLTRPGRRALVELGGFRSTLMVPLRKGGAMLGLICLYGKEARPFPDKQITLLQNFAAQAVIAMENARLLGELRQRTDEVAELNRGLEARVAEQVEELGRVGRLKRFLAPQLAELIVSQGDEKILESHRREIVVVFCDLRGYTAFTETAEPEEVLDFLREYHGAMGPLVAEYEGTLDQFSGDGIMVFFNDPVPIPDPAERAVKMAMAMREAAGTLIADWRERGRDLGFGAGIAQGYATLGQIGFAERAGYTAIGTVCNVAARLCAEAKDGQILLSQRVNVALKGSVPTEQFGALALKGLTQPVVTYNVPLASIQPALRVIEGGPQTV